MLRAAGPRARRRVVADLFYRGVVFRRAPRIGDTLRMVTEVAGLRQNSRRAGRPATGLAALRISTPDQDDRPGRPHRRRDTSCPRAPAVAERSGQPARTSAVTTGR